GGAPPARGGAWLGAPAGDERLEERRAMAEQRGGTRREPIAQRSPSAPLGVEEAHPAQREDPAIHGAQPPAGDDPGGAATGVATVGPAQPHSAPARAADRIPVHDAAPHGCGVAAPNDDRAKRSSLPEPRAAGGAPPHGDLSPDQPGQQRD